MNIDSIAKESFKNGMSGAGAMTIQVSTLMWLRTTMNYQYKHGGTFVSTLRSLYQQGGIPRFYRGILPALMIGPVSRFGDTASNAAALQYYRDSKLPLYIQTLSASVLAGLWRIVTVPLDAWKTSKQVHGSDGTHILKIKYGSQGIPGLYQGAMATSLATIVGHYPWFITFNYLNEYLPKADYKENLFLALARNASIGFCSSLTSDIASNSIRVVKTYKQTHPETISYKKTIQEIITKDGINGLFFRGLTTKILTNGIQGIVFSVCYKFLNEQTKK